MFDSATSTSVCIASIGSPGASGTGPPSAAWRSSAGDALITGPSPPCSKCSTTRSTSQYPSRRISSVCSPSVSVRARSPGSATALGQHPDRRTARERGDVLDRLDVHPAQRVLTDITEVRQEHSVVELEQLVICGQRLPVVDVEPCTGDRLGPQGVD